MRREDFMQRWTGITGIWVIYLVLVIFASVQSWSLPLKANEENGRLYRHFNNFEIFRSAHDHLLNHQDLYREYPEEHWDLFKYSPAFALAFGVFAWLPDFTGILLWNGLNAILLLMAFWSLPYLSTRQRSWAALLAAPELLTSLQTEQSNGLMAGLMMFTYIFLERGRPGLAAGSVVASGFIKIFGLAALPLFLFYPKKSIAAGLGLAWALVFLALPMLVTTLPELGAQYVSWKAVLASDHAGKSGISIMGFLKAWFGVAPGSTWITLTGMIMVLLPFLRVQVYQENHFRHLALASFLIWVVIFNHMAESPTFIIAMAGITIWFVSSPAEPWRILLMASAILWVSLSPSDIFPAEWRREIFRPYVVKVIPCILIWIAIWWEMMTLRPSQTA